MVSAEQRNTNILDSFIQLRQESLATVGGAFEYADDGTVRAVIWLVGKKTIPAWSFASQHVLHNQALGSERTPLSSAEPNHSANQEGKTDDNICTQRTLTGCLAEALLLSLEESSITSKQKVDHHAETGS